MMDRFEKLLEKQGGFYAPSDIFARIDSGLMQSFSDGHSWVITQVHEFPRKKVVEIAYVLGDLDIISGELQDKVERFAKSIEAECIIASGRQGWDKFKTDGWEKLSVNYMRTL